ncbi:hypothetical protein CRE_27744 [Caenorhabditis remanei]|uniref:Uncharacterized protein n=1 Tax=Caenorhabditis remanei TaxID=31234 RepID=E3MXP9_CAERE|nr:hypothetical protein CRE_27744 [Caenorhabditis remanei]
MSRLGCSRYITRGWNGRRGLGRPVIPIGALLIRAAHISSTFAAEELFIITLQERGNVRNDLIRGQSAPALRDENGVNGLVGNLPYCTIHTVDSLFSTPWKQDALLKVLDKSKGKLDVAVMKCCAGNMVWTLKKVE